VCVCVCVCVSYFLKVFSLLIFYFAILIEGISPYWSREFSVARPRMRLACQRYLRLQRTRIYCVINRNCSIQQTFLFPAEFYFISWIKLSKSEANLRRKCIVGMIKLAFALTLSQLRRFELSNSWQNNSRTCVQQWSKSFPYRWISRVPHFRTDCRKL